MERKTKGFTLVELLVVILCCTAITIAAMTVLFTGARVEAAAQDDASRQRTARTVLTMVEKLAGSGAISRVETLGSGEGNGENTDWILWGTETDEDGNPVTDAEGNPVETPLLRWQSVTGSLMTGGEAPLMEGLDGATAKWEDTKSLLTLSLTSDGEEYTTSVYCRTGTKEEKHENLEAEINVDPSVDAPETRASFLTKLVRQYGSNGYIGDGSGKTFAQWYNDNWPGDTAWCACFLSWGGGQKGDLGCLVNWPDGHDKGYGNVVTWYEAFQTEHDFFKWNPASTTPTPADLVFFDWNGDGEADHVAAVLCVDHDNSIFFTIEGNSVATDGTEGVAAVRCYTLNDSHILGYGVLNWKTTV